MKKKKHIAWKIILGILAVVIIVIIVNHKTAYMVIQNVFAEKISISTEEWIGGTCYDKVKYAEESESEYLDLYIPDGADNNTPLVVVVHGGGFIYGDSQTKQATLAYQYFRDHGYACASVNYRLAQEACFPAALEDVKAAVRYLRANALEYGYDPDNIIIWGESAGGYLATMTAVTNDDEFMGVKYVGQEGKEVSAKVNTLIDYYGCISANEMDADWKSEKIPGIVIKLANLWYNKKDNEGYEDFFSYFYRKNASTMTQQETDYVNPIYYAKENSEQISQMKIMIVHGDCDITVPYTQSERLYNSLLEYMSPDRIEFATVHNAGHATDSMYTDDFLGKVKSFIDSASAENIVNYRILPYTVGEGCLDLARAIRYVRYNADKYGVKEDNIAIAGFSAGGFLCGGESISYDGAVNGTIIDDSYVPDELDKISADANAMIMAYSTISATGDLANTGNSSEVFEKAKLPDVFYIYGSEDELVTPQSVNTNISMLHAAGVRTQVHILEGVSHGFGAGSDIYGNTYPEATHWIEDYLNPWLEEEFNN